MVILVAKEGERVEKVDIFFDSFGDNFYGM